MGRRPELTFFQRRYIDGQQAHEKIFSIANHQKNTNENNKISPHTCQNGYHQKDQKLQMLARMWKKGKPCILLVRKMGAFTVENSIEVPQKTKNRSTI